MRHLRVAFQQRLPPGVCCASVDPQAVRLDYAAVVIELDLAGIIATNTTIQRDGLKTPEFQIRAMGNGGLSGAPLHQRSCEVVRFLYQRLQGTTPLVGVGGVFDGADAWRLITLGASIVQVYTGFIYGGPSTTARINRFLIKKIEQHGLASINEAVGSELE